MQFGFRLVKRGTSDGLHKAMYTEAFRLHSNKAKFCQRSNGAVTRNPIRQTVRQRLADSGTKGNGLSEADLDVPAKLLEEGLQRREEAEALPRRQGVAEHDLLQLGATERVEVEVPRQVAAQ